MRYGVCGGVRSRALCDVRLCGSWPWLCLRCFRECLKVVLASLCACETNSRQCWFVHSFSRLAFVCCNRSAETLARHCWWWCSMSSVSLRPVLCRVVFQGWVCSVVSVALVCLTGRRPVGTPERAKCCVEVTIWLWWWCLVCTSCVILWCNGCLLSGMRELSGSGGMIGMAAVVLDDVPALLLGVTVMLVVVLVLKRVVSMAWDGGVNG